MLAIFLRLSFTKAPHNTYSFVGHFRRAARRVGPHGSDVVHHVAVRVPRVRAPAVQVTVDVRRERARGQRQDLARDECARVAAQALAVGLVRSVGVPVDHDRASAKRPQCQYDFRHVRRHNTLI